MSQSNTTPALDENLLEEAALWVARLERDGDEVRGEFEVWLHASPDNTRAHQAVSTAWAVVGAVGAEPGLISRRRAALDSASRASRRRLSAFRDVSLKRRALVAAAALILVGGASFFLIRQPAAHIYETVRGEQRTVTLSDNSKVSLDESTRISVTYSNRFRDIHLLKGQAEFQVAHSPLRPFSVSAGGRKVVATGTLFNVDLLGDQLIVTLVRGGVVVGSDEAPSDNSAIIPLQPSERLTINRAAGSIEKSQVDTADVQAWKLGKLVFESTELADAVARVNRYAPLKIRLIAPGQAKLPVSGVFDIGDSNAFAEAISAQLPLTYATTSQAIVLAAR